MTSSNTNDFVDMLVCDRMEWSDFTKGGRDVRWKRLNPNDKHVYVAIATVYITNRGFLMRPGDVFTFAYDADGGWTLKFKGDTYDAW